MPDLTLRDKPMGVTFIIVLFTLMGLINIGTAFLTLKEAGQLPWFLLPVSTVASAVLFLIGIFQLFTAYTVWAKEPIAKVLVILFTVFGLLSFPIGTVLSIITLVILFTPEVKAYLS